MTAGRLTVGAHSYVHGKIFYYLGDHTSVHIGSFCSIADEVAFIPGGNHRSEWVTTFPLRVAFDLDGAFEDGNPSAKGDIVVGNDVWIGRRATILSGVHIGSGAVVAAGSVVSKDVSPYTIVAGNPAQEIRRRFSDDQVSRLLRLAWWDWPIERVLESADTLCSPDVESLLRREGL